jgi:hypothetical protein
LRCLFYRPLSTIPDILTSNRDGPIRPLALELEIIRVARVAPDDWHRSPRERVPLTEEPTYRRYQTSSESPRLMLFPILADRNLSENGARLTRRETPTA